MAFGASDHHSDIDPKTFAALGVDEALCQSLTNCGFRRPTAIQARTIPTIMEGGTSLIASETGNGKTLAFLIPLLQQALAFKMALKREEAPLPPPNAPFGVVLVPGKELAVQIFNVAQDLAAPLGLKVRLETGGGTKRKVMIGPRQEVDLLIGSFGGIEQLFKEGFYNSSRLCHVVFDEADTLLDDTFNTRTVGLEYQVGH